MENIITMKVIAARRGDVDGNKYASLYTVQRADENDADNLGDIPMKIACNYGVLDTIKEKDLPGIFEAQINLKPAAAGKMGFEVIALRKPSTKVTAA